MGHPVRAREKSPQSQPRSLARGSASAELFPISNSEMTSKWVNQEGRTCPPPPPARVPVLSALYHSPLFDQTTAGAQGWR